MPETLVWKILLVDDDEDDYLLTREMLAMAQGKEVQLQWAASFDAGLQALAAGDYDAVLIDYDLGEHTGLELIRQVVAQDFPAPLVLVTGRGGYEVDLEAMQAGATLYLTKTELNPPLLDRSIRYAIERKQTEVALGEARQQLERRVQERTQELAQANLQLETARLTLESTVARRTNELSRANHKLAEQMVELETALSERQQKELRIDRLTRLYLTLSRVNEAIVRTRDPVELYSRICKIVADGGDFPLVWIGEVQDVQVVPLAACGPATGYLKEIRVETQGPLSKGPSGRSLREDRPVVNDDFATNSTTSPWREAALRYGIHSSASFPLHRQGRPIGTFTLYSRQTSTFDPELVALLAQLSDDVSYALDALDQEQLRLQAEQALRTNEERYRSLFNDMTEGFALHEIILNDQGTPVDYRFLEINPAFEKLTGLKRADVIGKTHSQLLPDDDPRWVEIYGRVALDGEQVHFENYSPALKQHYEVYAYCPAPRQFAVLFMNVTERKLMDEQLRQSETRLRRFYESGLLGVIYWTMDGEITDANDKFLEMTGYARQDLLAGLIDWAKMTPPEYQYLDERSVAELKATGVNAAPFEKEFIRKDGTRFPVILAGAMLDEARINGVAFALDITSRKQAEAALSESEERYRALFEGIQEGFSLVRILRGDDGRAVDLEYLDANPAFERTMGRTREQIIGHTGRELLPNLTQEWLEVFDRVEQTGEPAHQTSYSKSIQKHFEAFLFRPAEGQVAVLANDVTQRKQAEEKLGQMSWLIEQSYEPIFTWDMDGGILSWNRGCEQIYGYTAAEALGRSSHELLKTHPVPGETFIPELLAKGAWTGELHHWTKDGREVIVESRQELAETGGRRLVLEVNRDITGRIQAEQALREAHQRVEWLARFPQENPNPVVRVDLSGRILYRNPVASRLPGWKRRVGQRIDGALLPLIRQAVAQGREVEDDVRMDGGFYAVSAVPLLQEGYVNIYGRDVARRRLVEQALELRSQELELARREAENEKRLLQAVMEALPVGLAITDAAGGNYFNNPAFDLVWGGMKHVDSIQEYVDFKAWWADTGQLVKPEEWASAQAILKGEPVVGQVLELQGFDGLRRVVINSAAPIRDAGGKITGSAVSIQDVTALRQAQQALRAGEKRWATTLASIGDAVVTTDRQGRVTYFNPVAEKLSGWSIQEAAGLPMEQVFRLVNEDTHLPAENPVEKVLLSGQVTGLANHTSLISRDGQFIPIEDSAAPILDSAGQTLGVVMVFHDVTEKRKKEAALRETEALMRDYAQKLERSNRELQDFAAIASHDLQEPLRKIRAFSDLLQARLQGRLDEQELDLLKRMLGATVRMHELIDSLLAYSRVTTKAQPFKMVDLRQVAEEIVAGFEVQIERCGGRVEVGELPCVQADPVQMRQLLQNLVGNALKFHRPGVPPLVQIRAVATLAPAARESGVVPEEAHAFACFEVKDNGIGFEMKYKERIFRPFERLHGRGEFEGAGMGLAICNKIVERHQGAIDVCSVVGEGSTFIVTLPVRQ